MKTREYKFPAVLKKLLEDNNMTQRQLADKIVSAQNTVWKWLNKDSLPNVLMLMEVSRVFNVSIDYLIYGEDGGRWSD